jgi:hypothetical protein
MNSHSQLRQLHADLEPLSADAKVPVAIFHVFKALLTGVAEDAGADHPVVVAISQSVESVPSNETPKVATLRVLTGQLLAAVSA